jgi:putative transposase
MGFCSKVIVDQDKTKNYKKPTMNILTLLQPIKDCVGKTTLHQLSRPIAAMLAMTGRVTMLGISRWTGEGGSYRTIQRWYTTVIPWA